MARSSTFSLRSILPTLLYLLLIAGAVVGIYASVATIILKSARHQFHIDQIVGYYNWAFEVWLLERMVQVGKDFPELADYSWHNATTPQNCGMYYLRYFEFNCLFIVALLAFRRRVLRCLDDFVEWALQPDCKTARLSVLVSVIFVLVAFESKFLLGFWYPGIHGWTYHYYPSGVRQSLSPQEMRVANSFNIAQYPFLVEAVNKKNLKYVKRAGFITGKGMFLHFKNGEILPGNMELTDIPFPQFIFHERGNQIDEADVLMKAVMLGLDNRRQNRRFLLPLQMSYSNHNPYTRISYLRYPSAAELQKISMWRIVLYVNGQGSAKIAYGWNYASIER